MPYNEGNVNIAEINDLLEPDIFYFNDLYNDGTRYGVSVVVGENSFTYTVSTDSDTYYSRSSGPLFSASQVGTVYPLGWFFLQDSQGRYMIALKYAYQVVGGELTYGYASIRRSAYYYFYLSASYLHAYDRDANLLIDYPAIVPDASKADFKDLPDEPALELPATTNITNIYNTTYADVTSPSYQMTQAEIAALPADVPTIKTDAGTDTPDTPTPVTPALPTAPSFVDGLTLPSTSWTNKFPFSIPFDAVRIFSQLQVDPIKPVFVVPYKYGNVVDEQMTIDLSKFEVLFAAIKWLTYVVFLLGLMHVTRSWIKW